MIAIKFYSFLRAAAAGGAVVPTAALQVCEGIGLRREAEISQQSAKEICHAANTLVDCVIEAELEDNVRQSMDAAIRFAFRPDQIVFTSHNGTEVIIEDSEDGSHVMVRIGVTSEYRGKPAPDYHYRVRAAEWEYKLREACDIAREALDRVHAAQAEEKRTGARQVYANNPMMAFRDTAQGRQASIAVADEARKRFKEML